jgi:hypothetical protein
MTKAKSSAAVFVCPGCGTYGTIECFASGEDASEVQKMLARLPADLGPVVLSYLRLFTPRQQTLTWSRKRKLLAELLPLIEAQQIRRKNRDWPAPPAAWISAMRTMLDNRSIELPLTIHGYLLSVIAGEADKAEAAKEREVEGERRAGRPASYEDELERSAVFAQHCRTAKAMLVNEQAIIRTRYRESVTADQARDFLERRGWPHDVIEHVVGEVFAA